MDELQWDGMVLAMEASGFSGDLVSIDTAGSIYGGSSPLISSMNNGVSEQVETLTAITVTATKIDSGFDPLFNPSDVILASAGTVVVGSFKMPLNGNIANVDATFIAAHEGYRLQGYVPHLSSGARAPQSGITVGYGVDLGSVTVGTLQSWGIDAATIAEVQPYLGLKGSAADAVASNLNITATQAIELSLGALSQTVDLVASNWAKSTNTAFANLPASIQTVIVDVAYPNGPNLALSAPLFWADVTSQNWAAAVSELQHWTTLGVIGVLQRYTDDANLLQNAINGGMTH